MKKPMAMKLLDYTLIGLLAGMATHAHAQDTAKGATKAPDPGTGAQASGDIAEGTAQASCTEEGCSSPDGLLFKLRTRSYTKLVTQGTSVQSSSEQLQPDRRVTIAMEQPGKAVAVGKWSIQVPGGGVVWATEDPNLGRPRFSVSAPSMVAFADGRITTPVGFYAYTNYPAFIQRAEIVIFRASDTDLVTPLATIELPVAGVSEVAWDGALPAGFQARVGDSLVYVARAYGADGSVDETYPRDLQLVKPDEAARGASMLRDAVERQYGESLGVDVATERSQIQTVFGQDGLRQQNIPIYGSRIRIQGRNLTTGAELQINGQRHPVDQEGKMVAEYLVPVGQHRFEVSVRAPGEQEAAKESIDIDVTGRYMFAVALADVTLSGGSATGSIEPLAGDEHFDKDLVVDGRLAFYLKGKIKGKYLVTAQADTREREISELFKGFWDADPQDIFRRLDPDQYYPVYGDDSTVYRDVDTQGRLYVRVDWDKSQSLWGNFNTGITGTEYGQYSRALYGAALSWRSRRSTALGEPGSELKLFGSEAQTAPGHTELLGTGGSLYYLKHTDILPGSERVVLETRDHTTGRVEARTELARGADYDIDELQGRIILTRPLSQVSRDNLRTITRDAPLDGYAQHLLVDYEYVPRGFNPDELTTGLRARHWFGDHLAVGVTHVDENRAGEDYSLSGVDITLQAGRGTYLKVEQSRTEATSAPVFYSDNGGLSFTEMNSGLDRRKGTARAIEARANFKELGWTESDWSAGAWWRDVDAGYSIARFDVGTRIEERGAELLGQLAPGLSIYARYSEARRGAESLIQAQVTGEWRINDDASLVAELRRVEEQRLLGEATGLLAALQYKQRVGTAWDLYGIAQFTLDDDGGRYADNNALTLGAKYLFGDLSTVGAEITTGNRGDGAQVSADYRLSPDHSLYAAYRYSTDRSPYDPLFNPRSNGGWTLGQRWRLSQQVNLFNESQYLKTPTESGLAHTFGMDFYPAVGWNLGFTLMQGDLQTQQGGVDRRAVSLSGGRISNETQWQSKLEFRRDSGAQRREQWVTTNHFTHKINEDVRVAARLNYSKTTDELLAEAGATFTEANVGFAWRPHDNTRWMLLGRFTYLYDVSSLPQVGDQVAYYDQRSMVLSIEGIYHPSHGWEYALKVARREGDVRYGRMTGEWADSGATFLAGQVRYGITTDWNFLGEFRYLGVKDGGDRRGFLVGLDRDIGEHFRVGVGYNFTDFSDDLTDFDYDHKGWFLNFVGRY